MSMLPVKPCRKGHTSGRRKSGNCIQCEKDRYHSNPKRRAYVKKQSADRRAKVKSDPALLKQHKEYMRQYAVDNREQLNQAANARYAERKIIVRLQRKGIEPTQEIINYIENHSGTCDICNSPPDGRWKELAIDHCHATGNFRGMLCSSCNRSLGHMGDDIDRLKSALRYLEHHHGQYRKMLDGEFISG